MSLSDPQYNQEGRIAKNAFMNYSGYVKMPFDCSNPLKQLQFKILYLTIGEDNDNHVGNI